MAWPPEGLGEPPARTARRWPDRGPGLRRRPPGRPAGRGARTAGGVLTGEECERLAQGADAPPPAAATATTAPPVPPTLTFPPDGLAGPAGPPVVGGRYRVAGLYRAGGLGRVWRAVDT